MKYNINNLTGQRKRFSLANLFEEYTVKLFFKNWALITLFPSWWPPMFWFPPPKVGGPKKKVGGEKKNFRRYSPIIFMAPSLSET